MLTERGLAHLSALFTCRECNGIGLPRRTAPKGSQSVVIGMVCQSCGNDWNLTRTITTDGTTTFAEERHRLVAPQRQRRHSAR